MTSHSILAMTVFACMTLPKIAYSEWQGAGWGMSEDQTVNNFKLPLVEPPKPSKAKYGFDYSMNSYSFKGGLIFENNKLTSIFMTSNQPGACNSATNVLQSTYGNPDMVTFSGKDGGRSYSVQLPAYLDKPRKNRIFVTDISSINSCTIRFEMLPDSNSGF